MIVLMSCSGPREKKILFRTVFKLDDLTRNVFSQSHFSRDFLWSSGVGKAYDDERTKKDQSNGICVLAAREGQKSLNHSSLTDSVISMYYLRDANHGQN